MTDECQFGMCKHPNEDHKNGNCYAVTQDEKKVPDMFCKCGSQSGTNLRLYQDLGVMIPSDIDFLITKKCENCRRDLLMRREQKLCQDCKPVYDEPLQDTPEYIIRRPISQEELQKIL